MELSPFVTQTFVAIVGYLCGSVPFGLLLVKMSGKGDIRRVGSGNIGATNVLRTGSKKLAALTLLADALKATLVIWLVWQFVDFHHGLLAGFWAFIGHIYPVWLKFKGGKGVATFFGVLLGLSGFLFVISALAWLTAAGLTRYSSIGGMSAALAAPCAALLVGMPQFVAWVLSVMAVLVIWRHRENIARLIKGEESRIALASKAEK